jgi:hypothetical protein
MTVHDTPKGDDTAPESSKWSITKQIAEGQDPICLDHGL